MGPETKQCGLPSYHWTQQQDRSKLTKDPVLTLSQNKKNICESAKK